MARHGVPWGSRSLCTSLCLIRPRSRVGVIGPCREFRVVAPSGLPKPLVSSTPDLKAE
jgi:hypothetical protein